MTICLVLIFLSLQPIVDTPFLTVLKTWTSSFEHSMIIHARVRFEFPKVSATRLALGSLNLSVLCLVVDQTLVFLLLREEGGLLAIPSTHRLRHCAISHVSLSWAISVGRSALFLVDRPYFLAEAFPPAFADIFVPAVTTGEHRFHPPYTCMEGLNQVSSLLNKLEI